MGAEKDMGRARHLAALDFLGDQLGHGPDIARVVVVAANAADRQALKGWIPLAQALQFAEAGAAGADREMGIEGQHHHFLNAIGLDIGHRRFGEGMPVAHRHIGGGFNLAMA